MQKIVRFRYMQRIDANKLNCIYSLRGENGMIENQASILNNTQKNTLIRNFFKIAWRNISHNKIFSFIHIIGLSIGISASLVIFLVVSYHFSFEKGQKDGDRIYRVVTHSINTGFLSYNGGVSYPLSE